METEVSREYLVLATGAPSRGGGAGCLRGTDLHPAFDEFPQFISPEFLSEMKKKEILEMEFGSTAQKIRILLRKMSKILNFLTVSDLEDFIEATKTLLEEHKSLRRTSYVSGTRSSWGFSSICRLSQEGGVIRSLKENA